jgi:hypothetical protein
VTGADENTDLFRSLALHEYGFAIEAEITARLQLTELDGIGVLRTLARCGFL